MIPRHQRVWVGLFVGLPIGVVLSLAPVQFVFAPCSFPFICATGGWAILHLRREADSRSFALGSFLGALCVMIAAYGWRVDPLDRLLLAPVSRVRLTLPQLETELGAQGNFEPSFTSLRATEVELPVRQPTYRSLDEALRKVGHRLEAHGSQFALVGEQGTVTYRIEAIRPEPPRENRFESNGILWVSRN